MVPGSCQRNAPQLHGSTYSVALFFCVLAISSSISLIFCAVVMLSGFYCVVSCVMKSMAVPLQSMHSSPESLSVASCEQV